MPHLHGAEMSDDRQMFVVIKVVKTSAMNKSQKRPGSAHTERNLSEKLKTAA